MTHEQKLELLRDYEDRTNTVRDLELKYKIPRSQVAEIAVEMGATPRNPKTYGKKYGSHKKQNVCPKCRKHIAVKGAKFCCFCGADIRTKKQILCEGLEKALQSIELMPQNARDEVRDTILAEIKELKG